VSALRELQRQIQGYLLTPEANAAERQIVSDERADARFRLGIYAEAYRLRLAEVLSDNFPTLHTLLGDEQFDVLARRYIDTHPSSHPSIRWYGANLPQFLAANEPWRPQPMLAETAAFEWALRAAFDAADAAPVGEEALTAVDTALWPAMQLRFHDSVSRLALRCNVPAIWKAVDAGDDPPVAELGEHPLAWLVWRRDLQQYFRSLGVDEAWALDACLGGESFEAVCEGLCEWIDAEHVALHAAGLIKRWINDGLVVGVDT